MNTNLEAINELVAEHHALQAARYSPLVTLARTLAGQMDEAGADPSTRLSAAYLSVLKDIERALREGSTGAQPIGKLARLRAVYDGQAS